jgi:hypothetical protein
MKLNKIMFGAVFLASSFSTMAIEYLNNSNGSFSSEITSSDFSHHASGIPATATIVDNGFIGRGIQFELSEGKRSEFLAMGYTDVQQNSSRWSAFSFKLLDDQYLKQAAIDNGLGKSSTIIHQVYSSVVGPKMKFYIGYNKSADALSISFAHEIKCNYDHSYLFVNINGEELCNDFTGSDRQVNFEPVPLETNKWYHVRYEMVADAPDLDESTGELDTFANGRIAAAIKPEKGSWEMFWYRGLTGKSGKQSYMSTFTHDLEFNSTAARDNFFKFGIYGGVPKNQKATLLMDEIYSNSHFSALPDIYRD